MNRFSAAEQGLGYTYQSRLALLHLLELPESTTVFLEKDDDLDFVDSTGSKTLSSLKHKALGDRLTDLSPDFWKSLRIWMVRYKSYGGIESRLRFYLFTTSSLSENSFLKRFSRSNLETEVTPIVVEVEKALARSKSDEIGKIAEEFRELDPEQKVDFLSRIEILDNGPRIQDVPQIIIEKHFRTIRREFRQGVFERLEGWWSAEVIDHLTRNRDGILGYEVSDKLANLSAEYQQDNLPITFRKKEPDEIDVDNDSRLFVRQLREIRISSPRIRNAILDYYRAFEQRSEWARKNLLVAGEVEAYEDRLVDEWRRFRDVVVDELDEKCGENELLEAGKSLFLWADQQSGNYETLRIRTRVTEPYVTRGSFHILANREPEPKVYWHPKFLERVGNVLEVK